MESHEFTSRCHVKYNSRCTNIEEETVINNFKVYNDFGKSPLTIIKSVLWIAVCNCCEMLSIVAA